MRVWGVGRKKMMAEIVATNVFLTIRLVTIINFWTQSLV